MKLTVVQPIFLYIYLKQINGENITPQFVYHRVENTVRIIISEEAWITLFHFGGKGTGLSMKNRERQFTVCRDGWVLKFNASESQLEISDKAAKSPACDHFYVQLRHVISGQWLWINPLGYCNCIWIFYRKTEGPITQSSVALISMAILEGYWELKSNNIWRIAVPSTPVVVSFIFIKKIKMSIYTTPVFGYLEHICSSCVHFTCFFKLCISSRRNKRRHRISRYCCIMKQPNMKHIQRIQRKVDRINNTETSSP